MIRSLKEHESLLQEMIAKKYIDVVHHPSAPLVIYDYSKSCQLDEVWNEVTCACRGLICDEDLNIVSRPFEKFFNYEEIQNKNMIPDLPFVATEKLDGSLGIMYWVDDMPYICTRGSFTSEQAIHATDILHNRYANAIDKLDHSKTYLFEIIYPDNKIVINYGDTDDIFLISVRDTVTGIEESLDMYDGMFKCAKRYDADDYTKLRELYDGDNREGFVVLFSNGFRMKLKYAQYFRMHFLRSYLNDNFIFQSLAQGWYNDIKPYLNEFDEENKIYIQQLVAKDCSEYGRTNSHVRFIYNNLMSWGLAEHDIIDEIKKNKEYSNILFCLKNGKPHNVAIWNYLKRKHNIKYRGKFINLFKKDADN